ncbi:MAG: hypothetical protein LC749_05520 [Actinobacteria bacterium]|nr:hypothetical protein [Actinomycetota bacterium]
MKKLLAVLTVTTALLLGGTAAPAGASTVHTMTLKIVTVSETDYKNGFILTDKDYRNGVLVGRDVVTCKFDFAHHVIHCTVGLALRGGLIVANFTLNQGRFFQGKIVYGTRHFAGIRGVIQGFGTSKGATVQLTYTL